MEDIILFLMQEGFASDVNGAIKIYDAMSDEWLETIDEKLAYTQGQPLPPSHQRALRNIQIALYGPGGDFESKKELELRGIKLKPRAIVTTGQQQSAPKPTPATKRKVTKQTFEVR